MEAVLYTNNSGDIYIVQPITTLDFVEIDAEKALAVAGNTIEDVQGYKAAMIDSVGQGLAYEILKNDNRVGYVYNRVVGDTYNGASINIWDTTAMILAMKTMFEIYDSHKIVINPVEANIKKFISMLSSKAIRVWHNNGGTAYILKSDVVDKGRKIYDYMKLKML